MASSANMQTLGDSLIPVINKLQDIFSQVTVDLKLSLPQVAVIGSQSSGKSSVLEALVGRDFLPRGSDIVTRRPLVLQLVKTTSGLTSKAEEYGEFLHAPGKLYHDFDKIRQEILAETERVVGANKNVSDKPIRLKVYSPHVLTMTLVDLPGMTKVPVGDQPSNIEARIREMVLEYISQPSCIILAVSSANADLANSDALHMAQMVDPDGLRTIGVLTKLDIMDRGTNAAHILRNTHIPLRLGYVAIVSRSQEDINKGLSMLEARKNEEAFFASRPDYRDVATQCGVSNLARRLNLLLVDHIRALMPALRRAVGEGLEARMQELRALGDPLPTESKASRGGYLLQLLCEYAERFAAMLDGRHQDLSTQKLSGGARVRYVFNEVFGRSLRDLSPVKDVTDEAILTVIKNGAGVTGNLLVPQEPFELLVRRSVHQLLVPALQCKELVYEELLRIAEQACPKDTARFPALQKRLAATVLDFIKGGAEPAERMICSLVDCELDFINCDHPEFIGGRGAIRSVMQERSMRSMRKDSSDAASKDGAPVPLPRNKSAPSASDGAAAGGKAAAAAAATAAAGNFAAGLKGIPETAGLHGLAADDMGSRARRRSDDGVILPHDVASASGLVHSSSGAPGGSNSGSWFSWFSRTSDAPRSGSNSMSYPVDDNVVGLGSKGSRGGSHSVRTEQEEVEVEVIRRLVESYFAIVRRNLLDAVPKAVMHFMVNNTKRNLQQHLIQHLYKDEQLEDLLGEREEVVKQRTACKEALAALNAASRALEEVPGELSAQQALAAAAGAAGAAAGAGTPSIPSSPFRPASSSSMLAGSGVGYSSGGTALGGGGLGLMRAADGMGSPTVANGPWLDRNPSIASVAARVATVATAALHSDMPPQAMGISS